MTKDRMLNQMAIEEQEEADSLIRQAHRMNDEGITDDEALDRIVCQSKSHGATAKMLLDLIEDAMGL